MLHRRHLRIPIRSILNLQHASLSTEAQSSATSKLDPCEIPKRESNQNLDNFSEEFAKSRIEATPFQKLILTVGSSIVALVDPHRHDMIACLGETTGTSALDTILKQMKGTEEGQRILTQKPRINTKTIDIDSLRNLPEDTFGRAYAKFLDDNAVTPDSRMEVRFVESAQLAYVMTRYRECHDLIHTILGMPTNMLGEVAVKWVEALNTGLPMCYGGAVFGAARLRPKQRKEYVSRYLPWAIQHGLSVKPLMSVYWEERWQQPIASLRKELGIRLLE